MTIISLLRNEARFGTLLALYRPKEIIGAGWWVNSSRMDFDEVIEAKLDHKFPHFPRTYLKHD